MKILEFLTGVINKIDIFYITIRDNFVYSLKNCHSLIILGVVVVAME